MTKKIFRSIVLVAVCALLASLLLIMGCLYDYFTGLQSQALRDELTFAASGVSQSGEGYLDTLSSSQYRLTWIAADGTVLYDTQADAASMENHASREEVQQALATGEGESSRYSQTLLEKTIYVAKRLPDGTVLRISVLRQTLAVLLLGMLQPVLVVALAAVILSALPAASSSRSTPSIWTTRSMQTPTTRSRPFCAASSASTARLTISFWSCSAKPTNSPTSRRVCPRGLSCLTTRARF